jgi:hypothetical protein
MIGINVSIPGLEVLCGAGGGVKNWETNSRSNLVGPP